MHIFRLMSRACCSAVRRVSLATMQTTHAPVILAMTRQALPTLDRSKYAAASGLAKKNQPVPYTNMFRRPPILMPNETGEDEQGKFAKFRLTQKLGQSSLVPGLITTAAGPALARRDELACLDRDSSLIAFVLPVARSANPIRIWG